MKAILIYCQILYRPLSEVHECTSVHTIILILDISSNNTFHQGDKKYCQQSIVILS